MGLIQVSYKEGYFPYDCGNVNLSFDRRTGMDSYIVHISQLNTGNQ